MGSAISKVDTVGIPSTDSQRSRSFDVDTLGLQPDERSWNQFWVGDASFAIWEPARFGQDFRPQRYAPYADGSTR